MKINEFLRDIEKLKNIKKVSLSNSNEVYIEIEKKYVKDFVNKMFVTYKLYFVSEFCVQDKGFIINIVFANRKHGYFVVLRYFTENEIISLQGLAHQSDLFEREMADLFGLNISGGEDKRNIVKHEIWEKDVYPLRKDFEFGRKVMCKYEVPEYDFKEIHGDGAYQIPVGPVHAGIIEPGHFRFSVIGEEIENLEIRLMYKHRGIEKICENIDANSLNLIIERVAGESSAAYAEAYALLIEKMLKIEVEDDVKSLRTIILELERIYNFLDDIAGICVDVGYSYPAKKFSYLSEKIHQICEVLTGSRFLRNSIIPTGINIRFDEFKRYFLLNELENIKERFEGIADMTLNAVSFLDRVEETGIVDNEIAKRLLMTGVAGRASGIKYDVRLSFPYEKYKQLKKDMNYEFLGGVFERYKVKIAEIKDAFDYVEKSVKSINTKINPSRNRFNLAKGMEALSIVETVKGELVLYGRVGKDNKFDRLYFKTPSFTNWNGLTYAVLSEIVPDFPLCNKSFNMSYSENDR